MKMLLFLGGSPQWYPSFKEDFPPALETWGRVPTNEGGSVLAEEEGSRIFADRTLGFLWLSGYELVQMPG
jgi:hypothetical protein